MNHLPTARDFDCGDGVPELQFLAMDHPTGELRPAEEITGEPRPDRRGEGPEGTIGATTAVLALVILGQLTLLLAVLAGGDALIGAIAGIALLACGLTILGVKRLRAIAFGQR